MSGETWGEYRRRELRRIAAEVAAIEAAINAYWLTRWAYRLVRLLHWRPWR
jgi:hypothetical protein